ncbi:MAG: hypothetical protein JO199_14950 [Candidatus Eremiobacteraeota bacterium]|nr:hypothetical protein [Candidatus Eremiobacteraeota bacterium]
MNRVPSRVLAVVAVAALAACSFQNSYEREADRITQAMMANDVRPVEGDLAPSVHLTRVQVAEASDELSAQGKLLSVKETTVNCPAGVHCFDVKFEKRTYLERLRLDENGKVVGWSYHVAPAAAQ